jgi:hypothetical protein
MSKLEFEAILAALGGVRATARALGCSPATVSGYRAGAPVPANVAARLRLNESMLTMPNVMKRPGERDYVRGMVNVLVQVISKLEADRMSTTWDYNP